MAIPFKLNQTVIDHYLNSDDEMVKEFTEDTLKDFDRYIEAVATHQETLESYKTTYDGSDFREMASRLDAQRKTIHDACIKDINVLDRAAKQDNLQFCIPQGSKQLEDAHRSELGMAIMELHAQKALEDLTPEMKADLGEDLPQPQSEAQPNETVKPVSNQSFKRWENKPLKAPQLKDYPYKVWDAPIQDSHKHDPLNPNVKHSNPRVRAPKKGADSPRRTPSISFARAQLGDVVSTRVRFSDYLDEPYDVVHAGQEFGYVNAKYRPCMILGLNEDNVVLAPMYTASNKTPQMEMQYGGIELTEEECDAANLTHRGGTILSCANVFQVPKDEFTFSSFMGSLPMSTVQDYTMTFVKYNTEAKTNPHRMQEGFDKQRPKGLNWLSNMTMEDSVKSKSISYSSRIHPNDPDRRAHEARSWVMAYKSEQKRLMNHEKNFYTETTLQEIDDKLKDARLTAAVAREMSFKYMVNDRNSFKHEMYLHNQALSNNRYGENTNWMRTDHPSTYDEKFEEAKAIMMGGHPSDPYVPKNRTSASPKSQPTIKSRQPEATESTPKTGDGEVSF